MRIALAQLNPVVGDVAGNLALVVDAIEQARRDRADVLVTSELVLIGYMPRDLLLRQGVVKACEEAVGVIAEKAGDMHVIVGHPRRVGGVGGGGTRPFRNSASICHRGKVIAVADKQLLPGYDVFDEDRYFEPGERTCCVNIHDQRVAVLICEDLWRAKDVMIERRYTVEPLAQLAAAPCDVVLSLNASPFVLGKWQRHIQQMRELAMQLQAPVIAVNQVGGNDDLVFDGRSIVVDGGGNVTQILGGFEPELRVIDLPSRKAQGWQSLGFTPPQVNAWSEPQRELFHALVLGVRDYVRKTGHQQVLLGLSGGIDSALTAVIAAAALGAQNVHGVMMPSRYSSPGSIDDSLDLAKRLGLASCREISIQSLHLAMQQALDPSFSGQYGGVCDENVQTRLRGVILMSMSNAAGALVLATSNKSEIATGYSTLCGDMCGALAVLGDLTKTRIYELARWINNAPNFAACGFAGPPIPENSLTKPPSAELRPNQTDQDTLPPYAVLDEIIERYIEREQSIETIISETNFDEGLIRKTALMIDRAQYKRDQAPVILKVTGRAFGRGRPMPIVMNQQVRIENLQLRLGDDSRRNQARPDSSIMSCKSPVTPQP